MRKFCPNCRKDVELKPDRMSDAKICTLCGTVIIHSATQLQAGTIIGGFQIDDEIGRGGMGIVYRAKQLNLERQVALKVLADDLARDEEFVDRFFKEARAAAGLSHPNIVQVYDAGSTPDGIYYFAMELIVGETLETRIERDGALAVKDALDIAAKIASAMNYAWQTQKLCHGDIKPENIILNSSGGAKLADLGLAKFIHDDSPAGGELMATPLYAPPEVIRGENERIDFHSDMYSFGATLFHMLTGIPPFPGDDPEKVLERHLNDPIPLLSDFNHELPREIQDFVANLLAKNPADRPSSWNLVERRIRKTPKVSSKKMIHQRAPIHFHGNIPAKSADDILESYGQSSDKNVNMIKLLAAIAALLLILVVAILLSMHAGKHANPKNNGEGHSDSAAVTAWQQLHSGLPPNRSQAADLIQEFIDKYGDAAPREARDLLANYRAELDKLGSEQTRLTAEREAFQLDLDKLLAELSGNKFNSATPVETIRLFQKRVEEILEMADRHDHCRLGEKHRANLNDHYMRLSNLIMAWERAEAERIRQEQARLEKERQEQARLAQEKRESEHKQMLAKNRAIDDYFLIIAEFLAKNRVARTPNELIDDFSVWRERHKIVSGGIAARVDLIIEKIVPGAMGFIGIFIKHADWFADQPLPAEICPARFRQYRIESFSETGIRLSFADERAKLGGSVQWSQMSQAQILMLLQSSSRISQLDAGEQQSVLAFMVLNRLSESFSEYLAKSQLDNAEKDVWKTVAGDFENVGQEKELIDIWREFELQLADGNMAAAAELLGRIKIKGRGSLFEKRYRMELDRLSGILGEFNPDIPVSSLLDDINGELADGKQAARALDTLMMIRNRYGRGELDKELQDGLVRARGRILSLLVKNSSVKKFEDNRVPFYYWELESPGDAWAYSQIINKSDSFSKYPKILNSLKLAALLDLGDWASAHSLQKEGNLLNPNQLSGAKNLQTWATSFIFAQGLLASRYNNGTAQAQILNQLKAASEADFGSASQVMRPLTRQLFIEYALMCHRPVQARDNATQYPFNFRQYPKFELRIALLHLLSQILQHDINPNEFSKSVKTYAGKYRVHKELRADLQLIRQVSAILHGKLDAAATVKLLQSKLAAPDICARLVIAALARGKTVGPDVNPDPALIKQLASSVDGNLVSGELWRQNATLKLALCPNDRVLAIELERLLSDRRICASAMYARLCMLKAGLIARKQSPEEARALLDTQLNNATVASDAERLAASIINSDNPAAVVSKLAVSGYHSTALWAGYAALLANRDPKQKKAVEDRIKENYAILSWDERLMLKRLMEMR